MKIKITTFGALTDFMDKEFYAEATDTESLLAELSRQHSALEGRKLLLAVNDKIVRTNTVLEDNDTVAIMPPYSGG